MRKILIIIIAALVVAAGIIFFKTYQHRGHADSKVVGNKATDERKILYYTCGMHPSVKVTVEDYKKGKTKGPICGMDLIPVYASEAPGSMAREQNIIKLNSQQKYLAGIEAVEAKIIPLDKSIRTVGVVAYDPNLRVAEQEYIQAYKTYKQVSNSHFDDAKQRARETLEAAKVKLKQLGVGNEWIEELKAKGKPHKNLILPDKFMWVYADIYEYESIFPQAGDRVEITTEANPSILFEGKIQSIEPIIHQKSRTLKLKIAVENQNKILKPNMYVDVFLKIGFGKKLAVPKESVLDTGKRKVAFVKLGEGKYQLRNVSIGPLLEDSMNGHQREFYPIEKGIKEGERIVLKGNYLLDSQSQLGAAGEVYGGALESEDKKPPSGHVH